MTKLQDFVDRSIRLTEETVIGWYQKNGPVHVEKQPGMTLCGISVKVDTKWSKGPARVLLRRTNGCQNCDESAGVIEDDG